MQRSALVAQIPAEQAILIDVERRKLALVEQFLELGLGARGAEIAPLPQHMYLDQRPIGIRFVDGNSSREGPGR